MRKTEFKIDLTESFEHLEQAPIEEAVIHWRARPGNNLERDSLLEQLKEKLPNYPQQQQQHELEFEAKFGPDGTAARQNQNWHGFRLHSADKLDVAQFTRDGFAFSRLKPYTKWEDFAAEAQRLWQVYRELAEPSEIQRLGVRFINLITPVRRDKLSSLLTVPPRGPDDMQLPLERFMHQSTFDIPGHPYNLNVIQTIQPPNPPHTEAYGLILDLDVFTTKPLIGIEDEEIKKRLLEMRWIKNKAFFTYLKTDTIARFKECP